jgi:hypothetical protein
MAQVAGSSCERNTALLGIEVEEIELEVDGMLEFVASE